MKSIGSTVVSGVVHLKKRLGCSTYHIEMAVVGIILITAAIISKKWWVERVGVLAVFLTFWHASVADRLEEAEHHRQQKTNHQEDEHTVWCYHKLQKYYYGKELCRTIYFIALGARSALIGVVVFMLYTPRRRLYRKHHPMG